MSALSKLAPLRGFVLPFAALAAWQIAAHQSAVHSFVFIPLEQVGAAAVADLASGELWQAWVASLGRTTLGFVIGATLGVSLGAFMAISRLADALINPLYNAVRQVPLMGYIPLISLWFGNGEGSKLFIIALAALYPTVLNTYEGLRNVDARHRNVSRMFGASHWQYLQHVALPGALPSIFTGLTLAVAFSWLSSVGGEFFFNPGPGLGNMMLNGSAAFRMDVVVLAVAAIGVTGFVMNEAITHAGRRALRWRNTL